MFVSGVNDTANKRLNFCLFFIFRCWQANIGRTLYSPVSLTPPKNLPGVVDTGYKFQAFWLFLTGINDQKFIAGVLNFSTVSLTPLNSFSPVSFTPAINIYSRISPRIFEKIQNGPNEYLWAWGTLIHEKNLSSKISCQTPFKGQECRASWGFAKWPHSFWAEPHNPSGGVELSDPDLQCLSSKRTLAHF